MRRKKMNKQASLNTGMYVIPYPHFDYVIQYKIKEKVK